MGVYELVGFLGVVAILVDGMFEAADVVESVISHLMTGFHDLFE